VRKLNRQERADLHFSTRGTWIMATLRGSGKQVFGIPSLSDSSKYHLTDGDGCTCPDYRFRGLSGLRIGHGGAHVPCSHILAVQLLLCEPLPALTPAPRLRLIQKTENEVA
jgi:predicted nucleic acid-binding Zn finger protein